jgi:hypothetical protein
MLSQLEKWVFIGFGAIILVMFLGAGLASESRKQCRLELAKVGRSAEDVIKICP